MAITHVQVVSVYVSDQDKALDFYTNKLGFEKRRDDPMGEGLRWVEVAPPGAKTTIVLASDFGADDWQQQIGKVVPFTLAVDNIQATYEELKSRGVTFTEEPTMQPWGMWEARFVDQDGNGCYLLSEVTA